MENFKNSYLLGWPWYQIGKPAEYTIFKHEKINELLAAHNIGNFMDFLNPRKIKILTKDIIEKLFVKDFLEKSITKYDEIIKESINEKAPDYRIQQNGTIGLTVEVYTLSHSEEIIKNFGKSKDGFTSYGSQKNPLETDMIAKKINKYQNIYPGAKQCLFCFFLTGLNKRNFLRAFNNFYGDIMHSNGALSSNPNHCLCRKKEMETVAGFFFTSGNINVRDKCLEYEDIIFAHNPLCAEQYKLPFDYFNPARVFQSYIEFLNKKPTKDEYWGNFLIRFYKNKYPRYPFIEELVQYCKQTYPEIVKRYD